MIEFLTLFLGLVTGPQQVELAITGDVARVELLLDGEVVGRAPAPPYRFRVDFGDRLVPRRLEALGYDEGGGVVLRSEQTVNLPRAPVALRVFLGPRRDDGTRFGRLVWRAVDAEPPSRVEVRFDGLPLEVRSFRLFDLPPVATADEVHVLEASIELAGGATDSATVLVGGAHGERVTAQLTAVPVRVAPGTALPAPRAMAGWLRDGDESLAVMAVEARRAEVVVVRGRGSWEPLTDLAARFKEVRHRTAGTLGDGRALRLLDPIPLVPGDAAEEKEARTLDFPVSQPLTSGYGGLPWIVGTYHRGNRRDRRREARTGPPQRIAHAVAAAGVTAAAAQAPRVVLLVLGDQEDDASAWTPVMVREYLAALRVPLVVWSPIAPANRRHPERIAAWGEAIDVSSEPLLLDAVARLIAEIEGQRILWVEGERFLHRIVLAPEARGVALVE